MTYSLVAARTLANGVEYHVLDTEPGTGPVTLSLLADITPGTASGIDERLAPVAIGDDTMIFSGNPAGRQAGTWSAWVTDGTGATSLATRIPDRVEALISTGSEAMIAAGGRLYVTDGTPGGTSAIGPTISDGIAPRAAALHSHNGLTLVAGSVSSRFEQLYVSDGTAAGTYGISRVEASFDAGTVVTVGDQTFFLGRETFATPFIDDELWATDGTAAGTRLVADIMPGRDSSEIDYMTDGSGVDAGRFFFTADDGVHGRELWTSNGTAAGTRMVADLTQGSGSTTFSSMAVFDGRLYFGADADAGNELWSTDGRTVQQMSMRPDNAGGDLVPQNLTVSDDGDALYFFGWSDANSGPASFRNVAVFEAAPGGSYSQIYAYSNDGSLGGEVMAAAGDGAFFWYDTLSPGNPSAPIGTEPHFLAADGTVSLLADLVPGPDSGGAYRSVVSSVPEGYAVSREADTVRADTGDNVIHGLAGNDFLQGLGGNDILRGGAGSDTLVGGDGNDILRGGETTDDLRDVIYGGAGNDRIYGGHGNDLLNGGDGLDLIEGGFGADTVIGNGGNDVLTGGAFGDLIFGNDGFDFINGGFGSDRLNGGAGLDQFFHAGVAGHGSDWIQDYSGAGPGGEGDRLVWGGGAASVSQFQVNIASTPGAGAADVQEAFVIYRPTGQILWALVDGADEAIRVHLTGGEVFTYG